MSGSARVSFSGHETFPFRYTWLKKAVDAVDADPYAFQAEDAMVKLGVGKNMVSSIRHWGLVTGMLEEASGRRGSRVRPLAPTELGRALLLDEGWDPYLEDPGTLWLVHWQLVSCPERATTWWWVFNQYPGTIFTRADIQEALETLGAQSGWTRVTSASLKRDIDVFIRMYAPQRRRNGLLEDTLDCPLVELGLIHASRQQQTLTLVRSEHESLPDEIFAYALTEYLHSRRHRTQTRHARRAVVRRRCAGSCVLPGRARTARSARPHRGTDGRRRGIRRNRGSEAGVRAWCTGSRDVSESVL